MQSSLIDEVKHLREENSLLRGEVANLTLQVRELAAALKTYIGCATVHRCHVKAEREIDNEQHY